jgi:hypothetical protein
MSSLAAGVDDVLVTVVATVGEIALTQQATKPVEQDLIQLTPPAATTALHWRTAAVAQWYAIQPGPASAAHVGLVAALD